MSKVTITSSPSLFIMAHTFQKKLISNGVFKAFAISQLQGAFYDKHFSEFEVIVNPDNGVTVSVLTDVAHDRLSDVGDSIAHSFYTVLGFD